MKRILLTVLTVLLLTSCSKDDSPVEEKVIVYPVYTTEEEVYEFPTFTPFEEDETRVDVIKQVGGFYHSLYTYVIRRYDGINRLYMELDAINGSWHYRVERMTIKTHKKNGEVYYIHYTFENFTHNKKIEFKYDYDLNRYYPIEQE